LLLKAFQSWHGLCNKEVEELNKVAWATLANKGMIMRTGKFENVLALLAALIIVFAVSSAANTALAADAGIFDDNLKIESSTTN
jgi:hypothetical protein